MDDIDFCDDIDIAEDDIWLEAVIWDDDDICFAEDICLEEEEEDWKEEDCMEDDCIEEDCMDFMEDAWLNPLDSSLNDSILVSWFACEKLRAPPRCSDLNSPEVLFLIAASSPMGITLIPPTRSFPRIDALFGSGCSIFECFSVTG